jgi:hypothetical protein
MMEIFSVTTVVALVWFFYRLIRAPRDPALRAVVVFLALQLIAMPLNMPRWPVVLTQCIALNLSWFSLMLFFLFSARGSARRARWEAVAVAVVSVVMTVSVLSIPQPGRDSALTGGPIPANMRIPGVSLFFVSAGLYYLYTTLQGARWAFRYAGESNRRMRLGLGVAAIGMVLMACSVAGRMVLVIMGWANEPIPYAVGFAIDSAMVQLVSIAGVVLILGASYAGFVVRVAAFRVWVRHLRLYHDLRPLWMLMHEAFPGDTLDRQSRSRWHERVPPRRVHRRYWRRVVEIRDGLVRISPHLADVGFDGEQSVAEQADKLREALRRQREGVRPGSASAVLVAAPTSADAAADVEQLVNLATALERAA